MYSIFYHHRTFTDTGNIVAGLCLVRAKCEPDVAWHVKHNPAGYPSGGVAMFAVLALGGDLGCSIGPQLTGIIADSSSLNWGLMAAVIFPAVMLLGLLFLKSMLNSGGIKKDV